MRARGDLKRFAVIHLATHGEDHPDDEPNAASLHLADGPVDAMEISQWTLNADLVALSACWSGRRPAHGRILKTGSLEPGTEPEELFGDEIYGLQAAFFAAGAGQILGTLWPLNDSIGRAVMKPSTPAYPPGMPPSWPSRPPPRGGCVLPATGSVPRRLGGTPPSPRTRSRQRGGRAAAADPAHAPDTYARRRGIFCHGPMWT